MAEFNLEVEMTARTDQLDKAFKKAQAGAEKTADKMNSAGASGASGIGKLAVAGAAVVASMAALELSAGLAGAAVSMFSGDAEKMRASLMSLPIIGGLITKLYEFGDALEYASEEARQTREDLLLLEHGAKDLSTAMGILNEQVADIETLGRLDGKSELEIAVEVYEKKTELIRKEREERIAAIEAEFLARRTAVEEQHLGHEREMELMKELRDARYAERNEATANMERDLEILAKQLEAVKEKHDADQELAEQKIEEEQAAKEKADREAHAAEMEQIALREAAMMEGVAKIERERKEAAKRVAEEEKKRQEEIAANELAVKKKMAEIEKQIDEETAAAEAAVRGATGTFDTAGGSFTTGVTAQVDQAKILNKLSQESRDFLAQIVQNTARMVGAVGGFA
tara:strand:+ start:3837 stop:5036 length:1200 start_codon:yes stop_codon:yes gene_type:complete